MKQIKTIRAWMVALKGSIIPLVVMLGVFVAFRLIRESEIDYEKYYLDKVFLSCLIIIIAYWAAKITAMLFDWYALNIATKTKTSLDDKFIPLFRRVAVTIIWFVGVLTLLDRFGVNISALVAALGVGSLAIALAAQDTIANIIAGFLIMVDRPFSVGDDIKLPSGERVKVVDIGIRRSKFTAEDDARIIMPNLELSKSKVVNYTRKT